MSVLRHEIDSESGLTDFDNWILNTIDVNTHIHHNSGNKSTHNFITNIKGKDRTRISKDFVSFCLQF